MEKRYHVILLLAFSCLLSIALSRAIVEKTELDIKTGTDAAAGVDQSNPNRPWPHWEYTNSPTDGVPRWRFVYPPIPAIPEFRFSRSVPWPHWEFVQPPVASGSRWMPGDLPHWQFVYPGMPAGGSPPAATATPPLQRLEAV